MRKSTFIKSLLLLSLVFIFLQYFSFKSIYSVGSTGKNGRYSGIQSAAILDLVNTFTSRCHHRDVPIFVIEPEVLRSLLTVSESESQLLCVHLCSAGDGSLLRELRDHDLDLIEVTSPDPRLLSLERLTVPSIPTHYLIHPSGRIRPLIHLVVFYKRADNFLWHSHLNLSNKTNALLLDSQRLTFGKSAGGYDRFPVHGNRVDGIWLHFPHTIKEFLAQIPHAKFIECDYYRAHTFLSKYPQDSSEDAKQFLRKGRQLLSRGKEILDDLGVEFWLSSGTCLGWYRQCGIITYSKDIDFGVWIKNYQEDIVTAFEGRGFSLKHVFGKESDSYELSFKAGDIKIDLFFFYEEAKYMWNGGTDVLTGQKYKYFFPKFDVCWTEFLGLRVRVPCPTLPYVTANYGQNWNSPVKQWDWMKSPANVKDNGVWPKGEWDKVMQVYE
ncbi:LOW QUALITY PROTEIN: fukutin-like [Haliotis rubra]|uniref:LOW QUALITY PROTEIN: fukutin-like n=1 Tax=Haliotis rubra TaxID=36100 RepID=UPI001EE616B5|nr:LOW QUALITY PROTEIN: fukutin-like [Haliotis rubra]